MHACTRSAAALSACVYACAAGRQVVFTSSDRDAWHETRDIFKAEVDIMTQLVHHNVVKFFGAKTKLHDKPALLAVCELVKRGSLYSLLSKGFYPSNHGAPRHASCRATAQDMTLNIFDTVGW